MTEVEKHTRALRRSLAGCVSTWAVASLAPGVAYGAASITAEKNCNVRIEGESFQEGDKLVAVRTEGGRKRRLAVIQISKVQSGGRSLGKVIQGNKNCRALKGLAVETFGSPAGTAKGGGNDPAGKTSLPKLDVMGHVGTILLSLKNMHQQPGRDVPRLTLYGFEGTGDVYPLMFTGGSKFIDKALGVGLKFRYGLSIPDVQVNAPDNNPEKTGKQQTRPIDVQADVILRFAYLRETLSTELRPGFAYHSLTHSITKSDALKRSPLRNSSYSGPGILFTQRFQPVPFLRLSASVGTVLLRGTVDSTNEAEEREVKPTDVQNPQSLTFDFTLDYKYRGAQVSAGYHRSVYKSLITLTDNNQIIPEESYQYFFMGIGASL